MRDYSLYEKRGKNVKIGDYVKFSNAEIVGEGYITTHWRKRFIVKFYADNKTHVIFLHRNTTLLKFVAKSEKCQLCTGQSTEFPNTLCSYCHGIGYTIKNELKK